MKLTMLFPVTKFRRLKGGPYEIKRICQYVHKFTNGYPNNNEYAVLGLVCAGAKLIHTRLQGLFLAHIDGDGSVIASLPESSSSIVTLSAFPES